MKRIMFLAALLASALPASPQEKNPEIYLTLSGLSAKAPLLPVNSVYFAGTEIESKKINTVADLLEDIPSVVIRQYAGEDSLSLASVRGFQSKQTSVIVDGVKVPKDLTGTVDLSLLPSDNLLSAEILKGGWSAVYGSDAEGGVISLFTKRLAENSQIAEAGAQYSSFGGKTYTLKSGFNRNGFEVFTGARSHYRVGFQDNSKTIKNSFEGRLSYDAGDWGTITAGGFAVKTQRGLPGGTPVDISLWDGEREKAANTPNDRQNDDDLRLNLVYALKKGEVDFSAGYGRSVYETRAHQYNLWTLSFDDTRIKMFSNSLFLKSDFYGYSAGAEMELNDLRSDVYGSHTIENYGYFINKSYSPVNKLSLMPMLRFDDNRVYSSVWSPKILVVYVVSDELKVSLQTGKSWQAPTFADLYNPWAPNPSVRPEKSMQSELSALYKSASGFYSSAGVYYYDIDDRIAFDPAKSWAAYNIARAFNSGLEAEAGFIGGVFHFSAGINAMNCRGKNTGEGSYRKIAYSPDYKFNSSVGYKTGGLEGTLKMESVSTLYSKADKTGKKIPAYSVYDLLLSKKAGSFELYCAVDNIFDERYALNADTLNGYYPAEPRTYRAGVKMKF